MFRSRILSLFTSLLALVVTSAGLVLAAPAAQAATPGPQSISFTSTATSPQVGGTYWVYAAASSGDAVTFAVDPSSTPDGVCTVSGRTVLFSHVGTCTVTATQTGSAEWQPATATQTIQVARGQERSFPYTTFIRDNVVGYSYTPNGQGGASGIPAVFSVPTVSNNACRMDGTVVRYEHVGVCTLVMTVPDTPDWKGDSGAITRTVTQGGQTWEGLPSSVERSVGDTWTVPTITESGTGLAASVTLAAQTTNCTLDQGVVTIHQEGLCALTVTGSGNADWVAPTTTDLAISVGLAAQTTTVTSGLATNTVGSGQGIIASGSGNPAAARVVIDMQRTTNNACVMSGSTVVSFRHVGRCFVTVTARANADHAAGNPVSLNATVTPGNQPVQPFGLPAAHVVGTSYRFAPTGVQSALPATFVLAPTSTGCVLNGSRITYEHVGTCRLVMHAPGNADYKDQSDWPLEYVIRQGEQKTTVTAGLSDGPVGTGTTVAAHGSHTQLDATFSVGPNTTNNACRVDDDRVLYEHAGTCEVLARGRGNDDWKEGAVSVLTAQVGQAEQTITYTSPAPTAPVYASTTYSVSATGGASGEPVVFDTADAAVCTVAEGTVRFLQAGTCTVRAHQAGTVDHAAAAESLLPITVVAIPAEVGVTLSPASTVHGQGTSFLATVTPVLGDATGSVQFRIDGELEGDPVPLVNGTAALATTRVPSVGTHQVSATYLPVDPAVHGSEQVGSSTWTVSSAATTTKVQVRANKIVAVVNVVAPGRAALWGSVTFRVDGVEVGTVRVGPTGAELAHRVPAGKARAVSASYSGYEALLPSSDSTSRRDPVIRATIASAGKKSKGWHRGPVTVRFTCSSTGAAPIGVCPGPVVLKANKAGQTVTRTISATDGGVATVVAGPINIDRVAPRVKLIGVPKKVTGRAPKLRCKATDKLSGIATCTVKVKRTKKTVVWTIRATDRAGNTTVVRRVRLR